MLTRIIIILFFFSFHLEAQQKISKLRNELDNIISNPFFKHSQIAIDIYDLTADIPLYQYNNRLLLHPASNMKLLTSAASLLFLTTEYWFATSLFHTGIIRDGILNGDLYVVGGLDPDFTVDDLDTLVQSMKSYGIKEITGNLYADISIKDSLYWGWGWMWDDSPDSHAPYLSALNINDNLIEVLVVGSEIDSPATVILIPETKFVELENHSVTVPASVPNDLKITRDWVNGNNKILISGKVR